MAAALDIVGTVYGRLKVIERSAPAIYSGKPATRWLCQCECGNTPIVATNALRTGHTQSCGCLASDIAGERAGTLTLRHGHDRRSKRSPTYSTWVSMWRRCTDPGDRSYARYGGRGVTVCDQWRLFERFLADLGERPLGTTIDRFPNAKGNYEPDNCRWATRSQQSNNKSDNRIVRYREQDMTLAQAVSAAGRIVSWDTAWARLHRGWAVARAVETPPRPLRA